MLIRFVILVLLVPSIGCSCNEVRSKEAGLINWHLLHSLIILRSLIWMLLITMVRLKNKKLHRAGWLNILVFDRDHNLVDLAFKQLSSAYVQEVGSVTKAAHQLLSKEVTIKEPGYVYICIE